MNTLDRKRVGRAEDKLEAAFWDFDARRKSQRKGANAMNYPTFVLRLAVSIVALFSLAALLVAAAGA